jgi:hypothetical protein
MSAPPEISQVVNTAAAAAQADENYDPSKDPKRKPSRSKDPGWKYAFWPDLENKLLLQCTLCNKRVTCGFLRMKKHLAGGFTQVEKCPKATAAINKEMHDYMNTHSFRFKPITLVGGEDAGQDQEAEASSRASNATSVKSKTATAFNVTARPKKQSKTIADEIRKTPEEVVAERHSTKGTQENQGLWHKDKGTKRYC